ncbi:hypothetical protein [Mesorhizobium sp. M0040]|uniref:hypothetical protein n=1 Tax=Mesorhizobium sp. M0040 TaxID=2956855 RepID=UPI00333D5084
MTSRIGLPLVVAAVIITGYEGLPIGPLRYIPFAGQYLAMITDGRVDRVRARARIDVENEARARAMALIEQRNHDMRKSPIWMLLICAVSSAVAGCQTKTAATEGAGFSLLTPAPATRDFIIKNGRPFANQVGRQ